MAAGIGSLEPDAEQKISYAAISACEAQEGSSVVVGSGPLKLDAEYESSYAAISACETQEVGSVAGCTG